MTKSGTCSAANRPARGPGRRRRYLHPGPASVPPTANRQRLQLGDPLLAEVAAEPVVARRRARRSSRLPGLDLLAGAEASIRQPGREQLADDVARRCRRARSGCRDRTGRRPGTLVPSQPQPGQRVVEHLVRLLEIAAGVGVLHPQHEGATVMPGEDPVEQGAAYVADVQVAGRRRGKPNAHLTGRQVAEHLPSRHGPWSRCRRHCSASFGCLIRCRARRPGWSACRFPRCRH